MNIPHSWVSRDTESLINEESLRLKKSRLSVSKRFGLDGHEIIKEDMEKQIDLCTKNSLGHAILRDCLLLKILADIDDFNRNFPERYL